MSAIVDPIRMFGVDSGLRTLRVTPREARTLLAAARIVEEAHSLVVEQLGDDHYDLEADLCTSDGWLRQLATEGIPL